MNIIPLFFNTRNNFLNFFIALFLIVLSFHANAAVHLSAYRIYLDEDNRTSTFTIFNRDVEQQSCELRLRHFVFDTQGNMKEFEPSESFPLPDNSAQDWIRFSPKKFDLTPAKSQTIRFSMRRKAKAESAEYRSYLTVDCGALPTSTEGRLITLKPKLVHNVPIIVRQGDLKANVTIEQVQSKDDVVSFDLVREGNRSVYGDLELIDKHNNKTINRRIGTSIYTETPKQNYQFGMKGINAKDLLIRFTENKNFGGSLLIEKNL